MNTLKTLPSVTGTKLINMDIKPLESIIIPILPIGGIGMIYSQRGLGKTFFALELAYATASGSDFLNWSSSKQNKVLYIDGEMQLASMKDRLYEIHKRRQEDGLENIILFNNELLSKEQPLLNLDLAECRELISEKIKEHKIDLLILDNLSSLRFSGGENSAEEYNGLLAWARKLRSEKVSILWLHHEGKKTEGEHKTPRGSSRLEDNIDTSINLCQGSKPNLKNIFFKKHRHFFGEQAEPITVSFDESGWNVIGDYIDQSDELTKQRDLKILELKITGKTNDEIAKEVGLQNKGTISKIITECKFIKDEMKAYLDNLFAQQKQHHEIAAMLHVKPTSLPKLLFNCYGGEIPEFNVNLSANCEMQTITNPA